MKIDTNELIYNYSDIGNTLAFYLDILDKISQENVKIFGSTTG